MKIEGIISEIKGNTAIIEIPEHEACTKCCSCDRSKRSTMEITSDKVNDFSIGSTIIVTMDSAKMFKLYTLLYVVPLIFFLTTIIFLHMILSPLWSFLGAMIATSAAYLLVGQYLKSRKDIYKDIILKEI